MRKEVPVPAFLLRMPSWHFTVQEVASEKNASRGGESRLQPVSEGSGY